MKHLDRPSITLCGEPSCQHCRAIHSERPGIRLIRLPGTAFARHNRLPEIVPPPGAVTILAGGPGAGKTTMAIAAATTVSKLVILATSEQRADEAAKTVARAAIGGGRVLIIECKSRANVDGAIAVASAHREAVIIIDSVTAMHDRTQSFIDWMASICMDRGNAKIIISQETKDGDIAGFNSNLHAVDVVSRLYPPCSGGAATMGQTKNRFGAYASWQYMIDDNGIFLPKMNYLYSIDRAKGGGYTAVPFPLKSEFYATCKALADEFASRDTVPSGIAVASLDSVYALPWRPADFDARSRFAESSALEMWEVHKGAARRVKE